MSKFHMQSLFHRIHGLKTDFSTKVILSDYRGRNQTLWSPEERVRYYNEEQMLKQKRRKAEENELDDYAFESQHVQLSDRINKSMQAQLDDNTGQLHALNETCQYLDQLPVTGTVAFRGDQSQVGHGHAESPISNIDIAEAQMKAMNLFNDDKKERGRNG